VTRQLLEIADLVRNAEAAFIERNRQWIRWKHVKVLLAIVLFIRSLAITPSASAYLLVSTIGICVDSCRLIKRSMRRSI